MNTKLLIGAAIGVVCVLSSCLTDLNNLVTYKNVRADNRIVGNWQYGDVLVTAEAVPQSSFLREAMSTTVNGEVNTTKYEGSTAHVNGETTTPSPNKKTVTFDADVMKSKRDSNAVTVNGQVRKSIYNDEKDSLLYSKSYIMAFVKGRYTYYMACCLTQIGSSLYADLEPLAAKPVDKPIARDVNDLFNEQGYLTTHSIAKVVFSPNQVELRILNGEFIQERLNSGAIAIKYELDELFGTTLVTASPDELRQFLLKYGDDERLYSPKNTLTLKKILE